MRLHGPSRRLLSASQDGLVAVFDVGAQLDEDDGFISALNVNTSVEEMGTYGAGGGRLWVGGCAAQRCAVLVQLWALARLEHLWRARCEGGGAAMCGGGGPR